MLDNVLYTKLWQKAALVILTASIEKNANEIFNVYYFISQVSTMGRLYLFYQGFDYTLRVFNWRHTYWSVASLQTASLIVCAKCINDNYAWTNSDASIVLHTRDIYSLIPGVMIWDEKRSHFDLNDR